jgi:hypothetical protein
MRWQGFALLPVEREGDLFLRGLLVYARSESPFLFLVYSETNTAASWGKSVNHLFAFLRRPDTLAPAEWFLLVKQKLLEKSGSPPPMSGASAKSSNPTPRSGDGSPGPAKPSGPGRVGKLKATSPGFIAPSKREPSPANEGF